MEFTREQKDAIYKKDNNILVAAAAGSGKTAVLVERIIQKILTQYVVIDKLLVVTFTKAGASEMRERILDAIYKKIAEEPDNFNLQRQINLLSKSSICTIHSFCLDIIRNNFFEINLSSNFRIGNDQEIVLLKQEVLEEVFEKRYEAENEEFLKLVETYTGYKGDEDLKNLVLRIYEFSQSSAFPEDWITEKVEMFNPDKKVDEDFAKSIWGEILLKDLKEEILDGKNTLKAILNKMNRYSEMLKFTSVISEDISKLDRLENAINESWNKAFEESLIFGFERWPVDKNVTMPLKDEARDLRKKVSEKINKALGKILLYNSEDAYNDVFAMYNTLKALKNVVLEFSNEFAQRKNESNIIDFNDIEHFALKLLIKKDENGNYIKTETAEKYSNKFEEVAVDEYQDSNQVQELILSSVSNGKNMFMVGDIKQSIYKFRKACPKLFADKYNKYSLDNNGNEYGLKIQLFKNFRSRKNILDVTNLVFDQIMSKELGDIDYTEEEYLNLGASYEETVLGNSEIHIIDLNDDIDEEDEVIEEAKTIEKEELESKFVAQKIKELIKSEVKVFDKKQGYRNIKYKDIVILLRSTKNANIYEKEFLKNDIPVYSDSQSEFLETFEIRIVMNLLKILDNPLNDISLVSILRSPIFGFTDNEIIEIRLLNREDKFYYTLLEAKEKLENETLKNKVINCLELIEKWKRKSEYVPLSELLWEIYVETGFYNYVALMSNGILRQANLKILFERVKDYEKTSFKGLFNFIRFMEKVKSGNSDFSQAKVIGENEDVVRIMSIHKSKGLEFPVVFLCNSAKRINLQDLNGDILLHDDIGIGPEYINYERKIEYSTAAKNAIKIRLKEENISEEMRILYVALTRAREKLFVIGARSKEEKELDKKKELLEVYSSQKINPILLKKYITYLDWFELVKLNYEINNEKKIDDFSLEIHNSNKFKVENIEEEKNIELNFKKYDNYDEIIEKLNWKYDKEFESTLPIKTAVSTVKKMKVEEAENFEALFNKDLGLSEFVPEFLSEEKVSGAKRGTITHLVLQKIDLKKEYTEVELKAFIEYLKSKNFLSEEDAKLVNVSQILSFLNSNFGKEIRNAIEINKEKPFCLKIKAKEILEEAKDEEILIQGIIDLYFINEVGEIILVDYKTDFVNNESELVNKYKVQLELYKRALEEAIGKKVKNVYIYSLYLGKEIKV